MALTGEVDGVQVDSLGSDETSDSLQLALPYAVLENDVIGEVHAADRLERSRSLAADRDAAVLGVSVESYSLGHGALIVLHPDPRWISPCSSRRIKVQSCRDYICLSSVVKREIRR